jgi:hypothetical protein
MTSSRSSRSMSPALLIQSIVRQTATLLAQLANAGEVRAPLAHVTNQVFFDLAQELERMGVSRKVSADMFGLGLRTYRRKLQRAAATAAVTGPTLRQQVLEYVRSGQIVSRLDIVAHFSHADENQLRAILRDLRECGLLFTLGRGASTAYRATTGEEVAALGHKYVGSEYVESHSPRTDDTSAPILVNAAGEGTDAVAVWQGHPLEQEALDILRQLRQMLAELRTRVLEVNQTQPPPQPTDGVVICVGQYAVKAH